MFLSFHMVFGSLLQKWENVDLDVSFVVIYLIKIIYISYILYIPKRLIPTILFI